MNSIDIPKAARALPQIALVGNPNAGKTSLFNALTGSRQKIGNYPGVTVEKIVGSLELEGQQHELIDVPGLYSLTAISTDEEVAIGALLESGQAPELVIYVLDASNLERNLFLFSQLAETSLNVIVALTLTDVVKREQGEIDLAALSSHLGCEVIPVVAYKETGISQLKDAMVRALADPRELELDVGFPQIVLESADRVVDQMNRWGVDLKRKDARCVLLDEHCTTGDRFREIPELWNVVEEERAKIFGHTVQAKTVDAQSRYAWAAKVKRDSYIAPTVPRKFTKSDRIDAVLTHRFFGLVFFLLLMYGVFQSIYTLAAPFMDLIDGGKTAFADFVSPMLAGAPAVQSLVVDGIIEGVGSVIIFLPQIMILFLFIAILEGTGYLARAAFLMDRLLGWCGLNGRAFIPLLSSFACAIPGVMAARVMPDQRSRLMTVLVAPLMSCSARLPVYMLLIGAVIEPRYGPIWAGFSLFLMHFIGLAVAIPVVLVLNKGIFKGKRLPFMMELPKYQWPRWKDVLLTVVSRAKVFLVTAGTIIFAMTVIIWALLYFPRGDEKAYKAQWVAQGHVAQGEEFDHFLEMRQREDSILGRFGRTIEPVFKPAGFDWRLTTAILAAFPAREVVVPAMGILFGTGADVDEESPSLQSSMNAAKWPDGRPLMTPWSAASLMVFFALCCQCMATLAAIKRETNSWKWAAFAFGYMTALAYVLSIAVYQIGSRFG
ncbi:MAG: ferrous iron transport protein B [Fimbriimonadaceae bacterium]|nr:MAG: ferrous iron transport protein B [Fimbriimonadaceae bacterium]